jgi:ATP-dependent exoDNAse (exonuclease V) beta subunit
LPKNLRIDESGRSVLDCWEQGVDSEARRVLYVGASRAERLLVLAVHESHVDRVTAVLSRDGVSYAVAA